MKKACWVIVPIFLVAFMISAVASAKPIAAFLFPLSGPFSAMGTDMRNGSLLAIEEFNTKGGVLGKPVEVVVGDDEFKAQIAIRKYKEMVDGAGVKVIGGTLSGGIAVAVNEWACKNKVLYMSFCHSSLPLGKERCGYGVMTGLIPYQSGVATAKYSFQNLGKTWMMVTQDYRFGHDELAAWLTVSEKMGGKFLGNIYSPLGQVDYSAHIPKIASMNPDILVINVYGQSMDAIIKQLGEAGLTTKKMKFVIPKSHLYSIKAAGPFYNENFYGGHGFYWTLQEKYPNAKKFVEMYSKKYGIPPSQDVELGYTGTRALFEAMNKAGTASDVSKLIATLKGFKVTSVKGTEEIRACDQVRLSSWIIVRGIGAKASGWNYGEVVAEIPAEETMESCENNINDIPFGKVKLPGK